MTSFLTALLKTAGMSFGAGAMNTFGCFAASMIIPIVAPRIIGAVKNLVKAPVEEEEADPDLC